MPGWRQDIRAHLSPVVGDGHRDLEEIIDELASQLEDAYRETISRGSSEAAADAYTREHIANWNQLAADPGAALLSRFLRSRTFNVSATDPTTLAAVIGAISVFAVVFPAWRGTRVDPIDILRSQ